MCAVIPDAFPRSPGHCLIVPHAHLSDFFALDQSTLREMLDLVLAAKNMLTSSLKPDGWNVRINIGATGGQTVEHAHIHLVPRYANATRINVENL